MAVGYHGNSGSAEGPPATSGAANMARRYLVGIDLGTTNSALAYVDLQQAPRGGKPDIKTFLIGQLVTQGEVKDRPLLPSFLYLPGPHDLPPGATA